MLQLGGHAMYLDWRTTNFTKGSLRDEVKCLERYCDIIVARVFKHQQVVDIADAADAPVINGLCDTHHPCQALADLMTVYEKIGSYDFKLAYIGDGNNVCNSLVEGCTKTGVKITTVTPIFNEPTRDNALLDAAKKTCLWETTLDVKEAVRDADFVYTDTWVDMESFTDPKYAAEKDKRLKLMMPFQVNKELLKNTNAYVMHDMPIHRGYEITGDVVEGSKSVIYEQSENRLYSAKTILLKLLEGY
jgi:ornithine carbamoyltransferase